MNCGATCASYIAHANFINESGADATVVGTFKSGASKPFVIPAGGSKIVELEIDHGTWTAHDPLLSTVVTLDNASVTTLNDPSQGGVELREYVIGADHSVKRNR